MKPFNALICKLRGHKRSKRIGKAPGNDHSIYVFRCPRCNAESWRKAKPGRNEL